MYNYPDSGGHFGPYGGIYMAETLMPAVDELRRQYLHFRDDPEFKAEFAYELKHYVGRPSPIYHAKRLSESLGGAQIYLKRVEGQETGSPKGAIRLSFTAGLLTEEQAKQAMQIPSRIPPASRLLHPKNARPPSQPHSSPRHVSEESSTLAARNGQDCFMCTKQ